MAADTDQFIIATFALWAGDFAYVERLLRDFSPPHEISSDVKDPKSPEDFIRATGALRLRQLWQKRGEFNSLAAECAKHGGEITDKAILLETTHLRAMLWRTGAREFSMQGYLKQLDWQQELFEQARKTASGHGSFKDARPPTEAELLPTAFLGEAMKPLGVAWVVARNPFIQIELSDLGLIEASGLWTAPQLPQSAEAIKAPFLQLLKELDGPPAEQIKSRPNVR